MRFQLPNPSRDTHEHSQSIALLSETSEAESESRLIQESDNPVQNTNENFEENEEFCCSPQLLARDTGDEYDGHRRDLFTKWISPATNKYIPVSNVQDGSNDNYDSEFKDVDSPAMSEFSDSFYQDILSRFQYPYSPKPSLSPGSLQMRFPTQFHDSESFGEDASSSSQSSCNSNSDARRMDLARAGKPAYINTQIPLDPAKQKESYIEPDSLPEGIHDRVVKVGSDQQFNVSRKAPVVPGTTIVSDNGPNTPKHFEECIECGEWYDIWELPRVHGYNGLCRANMKNLRGHEDTRYSRDEEDNHDESITSHWSPLFEDAKDPYRESDIDFSRYIRDANYSSGKINNDDDSEEEDEAYERMAMSDCSSTSPLIQG